MRMMEGEQTLVLSENAMIDMKVFDRYPGYSRGGADIHRVPDSLGSGPARGHVSGVPQLDTCSS